MSRVLLASTPFAGHIYPMVGLARALVACGHEVAFYTGAKYQTVVEAAGCLFIPFSAATDFDDTDPEASFPAMRTGDGPAAMFSSFREIFFGTAPGQVHDILDAHQREPFDAMVAEMTSFGPMLVHELTGLPWATFSLSPLGLSGPSGLPLAPGKGLAGKTRDVALRTVLDLSINRMIRSLHNKARRAVGLPETTALGMDPVYSSQLVLCQGVPELEPAHPDTPRNVHYIGDAAAGARTVEPAPVWLKQLDGSRPVVHVSEGTLRRGHGSLVTRAIEAFGDQGWQIVVSNHHDLENPPVEVLAPDWVPHDQLFPRTDLFVTNGGYGGVLAALSHGVPLLIVPGQQDKPMVARNLRAAGVARVVPAKQATVERLRATANEILTDQATATRIQDIALRMEQVGGADHAAAQVEDLLRRP
ncbi:MAG: glycosyltransferase [Kocuria sp.]|nr:glycosyltransferase [Kocuria sp.]